MSAMNIISRLLKCPHVVQDGCVMEKVRVPTWLHGWWRRRQYRQAWKAALAEGGTLLGEWDDWLWITSTPVKASRRVLQGRWTMETMQDFTSCMTVSIKVSADDARILVSFLAGDINNMDDDNAAKRPMLRVMMAANLAIVQARLRPKTAAPPHPCPSPDA